MAYDAAQLIASLPADMRVSLSAGGVSQTVGRASVSEEIVANLYGEDCQYAGSFWIDAGNATTPAKHSRVTVAGIEYLVLGVRNYPGDLRRVDVGGYYGRG